MKTRFTYSQSDEIIYCKRCGQIAGEPSNCISGYNSHDFAKTKKSLICSRCGASIGFTTKCMSGYNSHSFEDIE